MVHQERCWNYSPVGPGTFPSSLNLGGSLSDPQINGMQEPGKNIIVIVVIDPSSAIIDH